MEVLTPGVDTLKDKETTPIGLLSYVLNNYADIYWEQFERGMFLHNEFEQAFKKAKVNLELDQSANKIQSL